MPVCVWTMLMPPIADFIAAATWLALALSSSFGAGETSFGTARSITPPNRAGRPRIAAENMPRYRTARHSRRRLVVQRRNHQTQKHLQSNRKRKLWPENIASNVTFLVYRQDEKSRNRPSLFSSTSSPPSSNLIPSANHRDKFSAFSPPPATFLRTQVRSLNKHEEKESDMTNPTQSEVSQ